MSNKCVLFYSANNYRLANGCLRSFFDTCTVCDIDVLFYHVNCSSDYVDDIVKKFPLLHVVDWNCNYIKLNGKLDYNFPMEYDHDVLFNKMRILDIVSKSYKQTFFFDLDILFVKDISPLFNTYRSNKFYGAIEKFTLLRDTFGESVYVNSYKSSKYVNVKELFKCNKYCNVGTLLINGDYNFDSDLYFDYIKSESPRCFEQDFLNATESIVGFDDGTIVLNGDMFRSRDAYLVHFCGCQTFTKYERVGNNVYFGNYSLMPYSKLWNTYMS